MAESRKTIFISSVQKELSTERRAVRDFVRYDVHYVLSRKRDINPTNRT